MKKVLITMAVAAMAATPMFAQGAPSRVAVIDVQKVLQQSAAGKQAYEKLKKMQAKEASLPKIAHLDLSMPVMGGRECFRRMKGIDPGVRVLISSGYSAEGTAAELLGEGALAYVQKPYDVDSLARVVRQALEQGPRLVASRN